MSPRITRAGLALAALASIATLTGCVVAPVGAYRGGPYAVEVGPIVDVAPPAPQAEMPPPAPGPGYVWIGGYWGWNLGRHVWIGGRWAVPPRGHAWVPGYWGRHQHGWRWNGGHWGRR